MKKRLYQLILAGLVALSAPIAAEPPTQWLLFDTQRVFPPRFDSDFGLDGRLVNTPAAVESCRGLLGPVAWRADMQVCISLFARPALRALAVGLPILGSDGDELWKILDNGGFVLLFRHQQVACLPGHCPVTMRPPPPRCNRPFCDSVFNDAFEVAMGGR